MTNRRLRRALLTKLDITPQALSARVKKKKRQVPMSTEDGTYVIAHEEGIQIDRYLEPETLQRVRELVAQVRAAGGQAAAPRGARSRTTKTRRASSVRSGTRDPILLDRVLTHAEDMARVYPLLYVLENSIRELIHRVMAAKYGDTWWDRKVNKKTRANVAARMSDDQKEAWHQRRGARPIDYTNLNELPSIVSANESDFVPDILPDAPWFRELVREVYRSRCVLCHMNPLAPENTQAVKVRATQWTKLIAAKSSVIPD